MKCQSTLANSKAVLWEAAAESAESLRGKTMTRKADLIDRDALLDDIAASVVFSGRQSRNAEIHGANKIIYRIKAAPTIDAEPVKHGRWLTFEEMFPEKKPKRKNNLGVFCDQCRNHADNMFDFCPNCGCNMGGE